MTDKPIALVTGATGGIGGAIAYRLQARDHVVFAVGRNPEALDELRSRGLNARALDVTDEAAVRRAGCRDRVKLRRGRRPRQQCRVRAGEPLEQVALQDLRNIYETNVVAMLNLSQAVLPGMRGRRAGTIVNIGSMSAGSPLPVRAPIT